MARARYKSSANDHEWAAVSVRCCQHLCTLQEQIRSKDMRVVVFVPAARIQHTFLADSDYGLIALVLQRYHHCFLLLCLLYHTLPMFILILFKFTFLFCTVSAYDVYKCAVFPIKGLPTWLSPFQVCSPTLNSVCFYQSRADG